MSSSLISIIESSSQTPSMSLSAPPNGWRRNVIVSHAEEMNPTRRSTMEDRCVILEPGTWGCAEHPQMIYIGVYDGHGGREIVDYLNTALSHHVAQELDFHPSEENKEAGGNIDVGDPSDRDICAGDGETQISANEVDIETRLVRAFLMADIHSRLAGLWTSGATVAVCLVEPSEAHNSINIVTANVGDSRVVLGSFTRTIANHHDDNFQNGKGSNDGSNYTSINVISVKAERLSHDHRVDDAAEVERIERAGGFLFRGRVVGVLAVTRSIGDHILKDYVIGHPHVHQCTIQLQPSFTSTCSNKGDSKQYYDKYSDGMNAPTWESELASTTHTCLIVACDGLWDVMTDEDAVRIVATYAGPKESVAMALVQQALQRGTTDNVTAVVAWLS